MYDRVLSALNQKKIRRGFRLERGWCKIKGAYDPGLRKQNSYIYNRRQRENSALCSRPDKKE